MFYNAYTLLLYINLANVRMHILELQCNLKFPENLTMSRIQ